MLNQLSVRLGSCCLLLVVPHLAIAVPIDGLNWMQVSETGDFTYNDLAGGVCDTSTGLCSGIATNHLGATLDLTGWTWASSADVADMFEFVTGAPNGTFDPGTASYYELLTDASWALDFIDTDGAGPDAGLFNASAQFSANDFFVAGITRSIVNGDTDRSYIRSTGTINFSVVGNPVGFDTARFHTGLWLYKTEAVSEPSSFSLLLLSVFALSRRRRNTQLIKKD